MKGSAVCREAEMSLDEVAAVLGVSRSRVQQIEAQAMAKLRRNADVRELARKFEDSSWEEGWTW